MQSKLKAIGAITVDSFADANDGFHESPIWVEENGIPCISAKCVKDNYFVLTDIGQVSLAQRDKNPTKEARVNDVLLTSVGTIGNCAVVQKEILPAIMDRHVGIIRVRKNSDVDPYYLAAFFNSKYGRFQTWRESTGNVQLNLFIEKINKLLVPVGSQFNAIGNSVRIAYDKFRESEQLYTEAERLLSTELGLDRLDLSESLFNVRQVSDVQLAGRVDAEYFNQKYERLENQLANYHNGTETIGRLCLPPVNGAEIREYLETGIPYLRVGDLSKIDILEETVVYINPESAQEVHSKVALRVGDVLASRSGSLGLACVISPKWEHAIISSHLIRLRLNNPAIDPYYLALFMNSKGGTEQIRKRSNGGVQPEINQPSLKSIIVPILDMKVQKQIHSLIEQSHQARDEAKRLLAEAKGEVERLIEGK